jgi:hypothetical protein
LSHTAAYDSAADRLIVFGGETHYELLRDTWTLDFATNPNGVWRSLTGTTPPARKSAGVAWDNKTRRLFIVSGTGHRGLLEDIWTFEAAAGSWKQLTLNTSAKPSAQATLAWDDSAARILTTGGASYHQLVESTESILVTNTTATFAKLPPMGATLPPTKNAAFVAIPGTSKFVRIGGRGYYGLLSDVWVLGPSTADSP